MAKITIDGQEVEAPDNALLLSVVLEQGVHVPHYCWHPKLSVDGSCRMCQVEIEGSPKLVIACNTPIRDGMVVRTQSPKIDTARKGVMELLLVNHPLDCPICDKAGECLLQDYSYAYGSRETRTREPRRKLEKRKEIGARMILDQERCILCRRCVRFCREVTGTNELGVFNLGDKTVLDILDDKPLDNPYSINTADICPVGALESKDFHHKLRVWFLKKTPSVCGGCSNGCNITVHHYRDRIWRMMPRRNDAVNDTWMCDQGRLDYQFVQDESRLKTPMLRRHGKLAAAEWNEAIETAAQKLHQAVRAHGAAAVGIIASPHQTNEELFRLSQLAKLLGVTQIDTPLIIGEGDNLLIKPEKAANGRGASELGIKPAESTLTSILENAAAGKIKVLYVCTRDLLQVADAALVEKALAKVETLIVQDYTSSPLSQRAHVLLPSRTWAEKSGTFTNVKGRVQRIHPAVNLLDEHPSDGEIYARLMNRLGEARWTFDAPAVLEEIAAAVPAFAGLTFAKVGPQGATLAGAA